MIGIQRGETKNQMVAYHKNNETVDKSVYIDGKENLETVRNAHSRKSNAIVQTTVTGSFNRTKQEILTYVA